MARERGAAGAFQLQGEVTDFAEIDGAPVAELPGPMPELVSAIYGGIRHTAVDHGIAGQHIEHRLGRLRIHRQTQKCRHFIRPEQ